MRIISGTAGRRNIGVPKSVTRPSTDRLREALFSILADRLVGAKVLDLFAGSGALGLEALSRGAASAVMVDDSAEAQKVIQKNLDTLKLKNGRVVRADVFRFLDRDQGRYDLVFTDPPYFKQSNDRDFVGELLTHEKLGDLMSEEALLIMEDSLINQRDHVIGWNLIDQRQYGGCGILFYQRAAIT
ncbi:MAG: 16S rRNA (guanine(966)-N(2))-methyltransferase RsmD [Akkermansiaceae bacterium]